MHALTDEQMPGFVNKNQEGITLASTATADQKFTSQTFALQRIYD